MTTEEFAKATRLEWINSRVRLLGESFGTASRRIDEALRRAEQAHIEAMSRDPRLD